MQQIWPELEKDGSREFGPEIVSITMALVTASQSVTNLLLKLNQATDTWQLLIITCLLHYSEGMESQGCKLLCNRPTFSSFQSDLDRKMTTTKTGVVDIDWVC